MKPTIKTICLALSLLALSLGAAQAQDMTAAEKQALLENILQADKNNDGAISRSEFETLIEMNADDNLGRAKMVKRMSAYDMAFGKLDGNSDGFLTKEEMQALAKERQS